MSSHPLLPPAALPPPPGHDGFAPPAAFESPGMSASQVLAMLRARWRWCAVIALATLVTGAAVLKLLPRTYTAVAAVIVNYQVNDPLNGKELPVGQVSSFITTQVELMRNQTVLLAVIDRLGLTARGEYASGWSPKNGTLAEWVANKMARKLEVRPSQQGSQIIYVSYSASDPALAASVANGIMDEYRAREQARETGLPEERARRNDSELAVLRQRVDEARSQLDTFRRANGLSADDKSGVEEMALSNLEGRLLEAQNARRMAEIRAQGEAAVSDQALGSQLVQGTRSQLTAKELQLAQMSRTYGSAYPGLKELQQQVDDLRRSLAQVTQSYSANAGSSVTAARDLEARLKAEVAAQRARVDSLGRLREQESRFRLEFDSAQQSYKHALDGTEEIKLAATGKPYTNVDIVSRARPPVLPSSPKVPLGIALTLAAALALGLGLPLGWELVHRRVRCRDDVERDYGIPVLAEFGLQAGRQA